MGTYKVIQDIEADDKLFGPFSLRQFIYLGIAGLLGWLSFVAVMKGLSYILILTAPIIIFAGFLAFPWGKDQPTELWLLAKLRFFIKPHKRIWDQTGAKDLVKINVPKKVERMLTDGLSQSEVRSRLGALANTIDSRGWAIKNVNVNVGAVQPAYAASDRLVDVATSMPQEVQSVDINAADDILDDTASPIAHQFDAMISQAESAKRENILTQMSQPTQAPASSGTAPTENPAPDYWFLNQPSTVPGQKTTTDDQTTNQTTSFPLADPAPIIIPSAATPTEAEEALLASRKLDDGRQAGANSHLKTIKTPEQIAEEAEQARARAARDAAESAAAANRAAEASAQKAQVTTAKQVAIMNLANTDDQDVATLSRRAKKEIEDNDDGEVVIPLR
jgi:hypothetical protein